jgi:hypothetical protein
MTFRSNAPRAEGIINCLHCINVSFVLDPARNRVSGNPGGVGIASRLTGVDREKASNVEINDGKKGKKYGKLRKCCSSALTTREGTYTIKQPFTPFLAVQLICFFLEYTEA